MSHIVYPGLQGGFQVLEVDTDRRARFVGLISDEPTALRIAEWLDLQDRIVQLIDRHGLVEVPDGFPEEV
jgi:hypothetical protein